MKKLNRRRHTLKGVEGVSTQGDKHFRTNWYGVTVEVTGLSGDEIKSLDIAESNYKRTDNPFQIDIRK